MKFVVPIAAVGAAALVAAGCALPAVAATASHHTTAAAAVTKPVSHAKPLRARTAAVVHPVHRAKPVAHVVHTIKKAKPVAKARPAKRVHVVKPVVTTTTVTVHGVVGEVTLTKARGTMRFALTVPLTGQSWTGIDFGRNRDQSIYSWLKNRSLDSVNSLTTQLDARYPGATSHLPADLVLASLAF
ncbi:MAG: hypothetical protein ACTHJL_02085 [Amnibacterium sp.]